MIWSMKEMTLYRFISQSVLYFIHFVEQNILTDKIYMEAAILVSPDNSSHNKLGPLQNRPLHNQSIANWTITKCVAFISNSYGKREVSSNFKLRTSHFEVQTSDFGIVIFRRGGQYSNLFRQDFTLRSSDFIFWNRYFQEGRL